MSDATVDGRHTVARRSSDVLDRAFVAAYIVALSGSLAVSLLTYVYVGPGAQGVREANPVTAAIIASIGLEGMVAVRTAVLIGSYWCYAYLRAWTSWSTVAVGFAWLGATLQIVNLIADLQVAAAAGFPSTTGLLAGLLVVAPALLAGVLFRPPADPDA